MERELEVKILNVDLDDLEKKLISIGAVKISDELQENILIDSSKHPINGITDGYLRIRTVSKGGIEKSEITFKKKLGDTDVRRYDEYTTIIESKENCISILKLLGYDSFDFETKHRRSYTYSNARFDLDEWTSMEPELSYMEIEITDEGQLNELLEVLNISKSNVSLLSIKELKNKFNIK